MRINMELPKLSLPAFPNIHLSFFINLPVLMAILVLFFVVYSIISYVIIYHWSTYGMKSHGILVAETFFLFVSVVLFVTSGLALYYF